MSDTTAIRKSVSFDEKSLDVVEGVMEKHAAGLSQALRFIVLDWSERIERERKLEDFLQRNPPVHGRALVADGGDEQNNSRSHELD